MGSREGKELKRVFFAVNSNEEISMKKTFLTCVAVVALLAIASGAGAITCTIDQRPAATLLIPYFQATFNPDGTVLNTGTTALDTLVTIGNASSAPMLAHVSVWSERTELVLDFNIALTGFDIQSFSVAQVLRGFLPVTPVNQGHVPEVQDTHQVTIDGDVCQKVCNTGPCPPVYPDPGGYLRSIPQNPANAGFDNTSATVAYPPGPFPSSFLFQVLDSLDASADSHTCGGTDVENGDPIVLTNPIHGYITIDHANYCTLSNPNDPKYYTNDGIGMENNLFGDYIYTSGAGIGTKGFPAVAIEADPSLVDESALSSADTDSAPGRRTFYRRYVHTADPVGCFNPTVGIFVAPPAFDCGGGDQREPLALKYAARWFDGTTPPPGALATGTTSFFNVWRASAGSTLISPAPAILGKEDLLGQPFGDCDTSETEVSLTFYDEDENTTSVGCTVSPCGTPPTFNFPLETQRTSIIGFPHPAWPAGWVSMEFFNSGGPFGGTLDQAYVTYDFQGVGAFLSAGVPAAQLDPTNCQPLLVPCLTGGGPLEGCFGPNPFAVNPADPNGVTVTAPAIPLLVGTGP
jgi:hypothetical protein